jgi:hypothetical protein
MCAANFFNGLCAITNFFNGTHVKDSKKNNLWHGAVVESTSFKDTENCYKKKDTEKDEAMNP